MLITRCERDAAAKSELEVSRIVNGNVVTVGEMQGCGPSVGVSFWIDFNRQTRESLDCPIPIMYVDSVPSYGYLQRVGNFQTP
jgi:hypothetical protein